MSEDVKILIQHATVIIAAATPGVVSALLSRKTNKAVKEVHRMMNGKKE